MENTLDVENHMACKKNREVLRLIIDAVSCSVSQVTITATENGDFDYNHVFKIENCVQMVKSMKRYYITKFKVEEAVKFIEERPRILKDIIKVMANTVKSAILKEMRRSTGVSLILSGHSNSDLKKSRVSTVARYICDGDIYEKFLEFTDMNIVKDSHVVKEHIVRTVSQLDTSEKFLALSCDGAVLPTDCLTNLIISLGRQYPLYYFVPCYFHDFYYILEQSLSKIRECRQFFKNLKIMKNFVLGNSKMCKVFDGLSMHVDIPDFNNFKLSNSQFLRVLTLYTKQFRKYFSYIERNYSLDDVAKAFSFQKFLEKYQTIFLLEAIFMLFDHVAILSEMLSSYSPENVFSGQVLDNVKTVLVNDRNNGFEKIWTLVINKILRECKPETLETVGEEETKHLSNVFRKMVDCVTDEINIRFSCSRRLEFLSVFNCETNRKMIISDHHMKRLRELRGSLLDKRQLKVELDIMCRNGAVFGGKSIHELRDIFVRAKLQNTLKNVYKLLELISTMPCKPVSNTGSSKLNKINEWAFVSNDIEIKNLSILCIEKDTFDYLKSRMDFHDDIILKLKELNSELSSIV